MAGRGTTPPRPIKPRKRRERLRQAKIESRAAAIARFVGMMIDPSRRETSTILRTTGARSTSYVSRISAEACPLRTAASFHDKLAASFMPPFIPCPAKGGMRWAASPARKTRPTRHRSANASMEGVDSLALDLERVDARSFPDERPNRPLAAQLRLALPRQLHEFPTHPTTDRGQLHCRTAGIAAKGDSPDVVI